MRGILLQHAMDIVIAENVGKVRNKVKSRDEAKGYCYGFLDALCELDEDYDNISRMIDEAIEQLKEKCEADDVRHGYWHLLDDCANAGVYCSECYKKVYRVEYANQKIKSKYCPNCGALMDLEEK